MHFLPLIPYPFSHASGEKGEICFFVLLPELVRAPACVGEGRTYANRPSNLRLAAKRPRSQRDIFSF
jgi:hypothetical protein